MTRESTEQITGPGDNTGDSGHRLRGKDSNNCNKNCGLQSPNYLLPGPLQEKAGQPGINEKGWVRA